MINFVMMEGNIGAEIEVKEFGDHRVAEFRIASNRMYKGEKKTVWYTCKAWNKTCDFIDEYFKKGSRIIVEGDLDEDSWENDSGQTIRKTVINVKKAHFAGPKEEKTSGDNDKVSEDYGF